MKFEMATNVLARERVSAIELKNRMIHKGQWMKPSGQTGGHVHGKWLQEKIDELGADCGVAGSGTGKRTGAACGVRVLL